MNVTYMEKPDRTCARCGKVFARPCELVRHGKRKTPCDTVVPKTASKTSERSCRWCNRVFSSASAQSTHTNHHCAAAAASRAPKESESEAASLNAKIDELREDLARLVALSVPVRENSAHPV